MNTTVTMTLDDILDLPPLTEQDIMRIEKAKANPDEECPAQTKEALRQFRPVKETHPELYKQLHGNQ